MMENENKKKKPSSYDDFMKVHDENSTMTISYSNGGIESMNILVI